ncbi:hypothetical protein [Methanobrevibacter sp.]|uniref:hypothetical protein n=1 Tax=Methanobrevibacter sp. TaxID=66852 RepID=UPI00388EB4A5
MLEAAYEITILMICVFVAGAMLGWFLQECWNTHEKIKEKEKELYSWNVPDHVNCRCSMGLIYEDLGDDDEQL